MIPSEAIEIRPVRSSDESFIYATWLRSYKYSSYFAKRIRHSTFFKGHHSVVTHLLVKPIVQVFVAHPTDDPETILGYLVCEPGDKPVVHFVFVKEAFRMLGIAKALIKKADIDTDNITFTHWTFPVDDIVIKYPNMIYNPYGL